MKCKRCGAANSFVVTHTYQCSEGVSARTLRCKACRLVATQTVFSVINQDPGYGQGAKALAAVLKRVKESDILSALRITQERSTRE